MTAFVYYKTRKGILRNYLAESPKEMWEKIRKVLDKGYTVTEVNTYDGSIRNIYTLHFDLQGEPQLKKYIN